MGRWTTPTRRSSSYPEWPRLLAAYAWLDDHRGSGRYLREITAPGVDTKFAERHRACLASLLGVSASAAGFLTGLGLRTKPELVRLRVSPTLGLPSPLSELAVRSDELAALDIAPATVLVCENEITYLSVAVPAAGAVLWGKGFEVDRLGRLPWLAEADLAYWGDLDTHGFAILDRLRAWLPAHPLGADGPRDPARPPRSLGRGAFAHQRDPDPAQPGRGGAVRRPRRRPAR